MCKIRKILINLIIISVIISNITLIYADDSIYAEDTDILDEMKSIDVSSDIAKEPSINSRAAIIYDRTTKEILLGKNENDRRPMASTTKIMTAIIVLENTNLSNNVIISKKAAGTGGSRLGLKLNDHITVNDLLYGLLLVSGNDAAVALAEYIAGDVNSFAELMNNKAKELNLKDTHFVTPHGLDSQEHYTTAYELAKMADYALENKIFSQIVNTKNYTVYINNNPKNLSNTNELLGNIEGVNGVKTGFTNGANRCLVSAVNRNNMNIITVVLGADTKKFRTIDSVKLIEYAYNNYKNIKITDMVNNKYKEWKENYEKEIYIAKGEQKYIDTKLSDFNNEYITIKNGEKNKIYVQIDTLNYIESPIEENKIIGKIIIFDDNEVKMTINILNKQNVKKMNAFDYFIKLFCDDFNNMLKIK